MKRSVNFSVSTLTLIFTFIIPFNVVAKEHKNDDNRELQKFIAALKSPGGGLLLKYESNSNIISSNGKLSSENLEFLNSEMLPILSEGKISHKIWIIDSKHFSLVIYKPSAKVFIEKFDKHYLESHYLKTYFICQFKRINNMWKLNNGFCYAEMDDPFSQEPDL